MGPRRFCLWGGTSRHVQVGSPEDRRVQALAGVTAGVRAFADALERFHLR